MRSEPTHNLILTNEQSQVIIPNVHDFLGNNKLIEVVVLWQSQRQHLKSLARIVARQEVSEAKQFQDLFQ
jgi:hypothetical protein